MQQLCHVLAGVAKALNRNGCLLGLPTAPRLHGHAYGLAEAGVRIELDEPLALGQSVSLHLGLPYSNARVHARADVVWINGVDDDPGPRRMALRFTGFLSDSDHDRLVAYLGNGQLQRAA